MKNLASLGPVGTYFNLIELVETDKNLWRKAANLINNTRRDMRTWPMVDRANQTQATQSYVEKALKDTKLPDEVKDTLKTCLRFEFGFQFGK